MITTIQRSPYIPVIVLACLTIGFYLALFSARAQEPNQQDVVARLEGETITTLLSDEQLIAVLEGEAASLELEATIQEVRFEQSRDLYYLVGKGQMEDGNCFMVAKELEVSSDMLGFGSTTHFCDGSPCSSCVFVGEAFSGAILGCECEDAGLVRRCNHTIVRRE